MLKSFVIIALLLLAAFALLAVRVIVKKNGRMRSMHISDSKAMKDQGIGCVQSQDRAAQRSSASRLDVKNM